jgi:hypothetical protein
MKPGQIRPLYLEPRLYKQSVKQEINNHGTCLAKPLHTKQNKNVWRIIGLPRMRLLSDLPHLVRRISKTLKYVKLQTLGPF